MPTKKTKPQLEQRKLDDLLDHPGQRHFFGDDDENSLAELAADIEKNGLNHAIEILPENSAGLPANTIISGHRRRDALRRLDYTKADVWVRHDLAGADGATIERTFLEDNQNRRHQSRLSQARAALRLFEIERQRPRGGLSSLELGEARDRVGQVLGMSGRNLGRYLAVLQAPIEVQQALERGEIKLVDAGKVAGMPGDVQATIAKQLRAGAPAKDAIKPYLPGKETVKPTTLCRRYLAALAKLVPALDPAVGKIKRSARPGDIEQLRAATQMNQRLMKKLSENKKRYEANMTSATEGLREELAALRR